MPSNNLADINFQRNIASVEDLLKLHVLLTKDYPLLKDQSDELLRAIIVLSVSALDNYLHDFYRTEIVEAYLGKGNFSVQFDKIKVSIYAIQQLDSAFSEAEKRNFLNNELRKIQKTETYQSARSIEDIFNKIQIKNIWSKLAVVLGLTAQNLRDELGLIIDRRNKVSHESDWDYVNQRKNPIDYSEVEDVVNFIKKFILAIETITP